MSDRARPRPPGAAALAWRQFRLERRMFWRNPSAAFFSFMLPLIFLALFGAIFSDDQQQLDILVPGIAGLSVLSTTFAGLAMSMVFLREQGVLKRMRGLPLPESSYLFGLLGSTAANVAVQLAIVIVSGKAFFGVAWPGHWIELIVFALTGVVCMASLGISLAHAIPNFDAAPAYVNAIFLPLMFVSGIFFDTANVPRFLQVIGDVFPMSHIIEGLAGAMVTGATLGDNLGDLAIVLAWAAFGIFFAVRGFSWESRG